MARHGLLWDEADDGMVGRGAGVNTYYGSLVGRYPLLLTLRSCTYRFIIVPPTVSMDARYVISETCSLE